jgi:cytochrome c oxidase subunit 3
MTTTTITHEQPIDYTGSKLGMWLFLLTEILFFGGMFLLYAVYRARYSEAFHGAATELNTVIGAINTVVLLTSSLTMALSIGSIKKGFRPRTLLLQGATICLALFFLVNKVFEWGAKIDHSMYPGSAEMLAHSKGEVLFYSLYYVMTGLHAVHVIAGVVLLVVMFVLTSRNVIHANDYVKLENAGLYWHLVDVIWIYLFPLFYLIT